MLLHAPSSSHGPSSSHAPPRAPKKGILEFISHGLFACFNVGRHNAEEIHAHMKYVDEQLLKIEARQKEIMAKSDIPHSPLRAPMDFPPPVFYNPWEEMGGSSMMFGATQADDDIEEDFGGHEESDEDEEDDVHAANAPTEEADDNDDEDDDE